MSRMASEITSLLKTQKLSIFFFVSKVSVQGKLKRGDLAEAQTKKRVPKSSREGDFVSSILFFCCSRIRDGMWN